MLPCLPITSSLLNETVTQMLYLAGSVASHTHPRRQLKSTSALTNQVSTAFTHLFILFYFLGMVKLKKPFVAVSSVVGLYPSERYNSNERLYPVEMCNST